MQSIIAFPKLNVKYNDKPLSNCNGSAWHTVTIHGQENGSV